MLSAALQVDATKQSGGERDSRLRAAEASASGAAEELRKKEAHIAQLQAENEVMQRDRCGWISACQADISSLVLHCMHCTVALSGHPSLSPVNAAGCSTRPCIPEAVSIPGG